MSHENRGLCLYCGEANAYTSLTCTHCSTRLPWADAITQSLQAPQTALAQPVQPQWAEPQTPISQAPLHLAVPQNAMMSQPRYCAHCGAQHVAGAAYCASCGTSI